MMEELEVIACALAIVAIIVLALLYFKPPSPTVEPARGRVDVGPFSVRLISSYRGPTLIRTGAGLAQAYLAPEGRVFVAYELQAENPSPRPKRLYRVSLKAGGRLYPPVDLSALSPAEVGDLSALVEKYGYPPVLSPTNTFSPLVEVRAYGKGYFWAAFLIPEGARPEALVFEVPVGPKPSLSLTSSRA